MSPLNQHQGGRLIVCRRLRSVPSSPTNLCVCFFCEGLWWLGLDQRRVGRSRFSEVGVQHEQVWGSGRDVRRNPPSRTSWSLWGVSERWRRLAYSGRSFLWSRTGASSRSLLVSSAAVAPPTVVCTPSRSVGLRAVKLQPGGLTAAWLLVQVKAWCSSSEGEAGLPGWSVRGFLRLVQVKTFQIREPTSLLHSACCFFTCSFCPLLVLLSL